MSTTTSSAGPAVPAPPSLPESSEPRDTLRLTSVLAAGLPPNLGTPDEPVHYTVPVVFSRRVTAAERARIEDPATAAIRFE